MKDKDSQLNSMKQKLDSLMTEKLFIENKYKNFEKQHKEYIEAEKTNYLQIIDKIHEESQRYKSELENLKAEINSRPLYEDYKRNQEKIKNDIEVLRINIREKENIIDDLKKSRENNIRIIKENHMNELVYLKNNFRII